MSLFGCPRWSRKKKACITEAFGKSDGEKYLYYRLWDGIEKDPNVFPKPVPRLELFHHKAPPSLEQMGALIMGPNGGYAFQRHKFRPKNSESFKEKRTCSKRAMAFFEALGVVVTFLWLIPLFKSFFEITKTDCCCCFVREKAKPNDEEWEPHDLVDKMAGTHRTIWLHEMKLVDISVAVDEKGNRRMVANDETSKSYIKWAGRHEAVELRRLQKSTMFADWLWTREFLGDPDRKEKNLTHLDYEVYRYKCSKRCVGNWVSLFLTIVFIVGFVLIDHFAEALSDIVLPYLDFVVNHWWGFLLGVLAMVILSIPPLFGHELLLLLAGMLYGFPSFTTNPFSIDWAGWEALVIASVGTILGEIVSWYLSKGVLKKHCEETIRTKTVMVALARLTEWKGFGVILAVRLSVIPSHLSTAVFALCGVPFWKFLLASVFTLAQPVFYVLLGAIAKGKITLSGIWTKLFYIGFLALAIVPLLFYAKPAIRVHNLLRQKFFNSIMEGILSSQENVWSKEQKRAWKRSFIWGEPFIKGYHRDKHGNMRKNLGDGDDLHFDQGSGRQSRRKGKIQAYYPGVPVEYTDWEPLVNDADETADIRRYTTNPYEWNFDNDVFI